MSAALRDGELLRRIEIVARNEMGALRFKTYIVRPEKVADKLLKLHRKYDILSTRVTYE